MQSTLLSIFLLLSTLTAQARFAAIFKQSDFQGEQLRLQNQWSCTDSPNFCGSVGSVYVPDGWEVWCFSSRDFSGTPLRLTSSWTGSEADAWKWRSSIRSIRVVQSIKGGSTCNSGVALFKGQELTGDHLWLEESWDGSTPKAFASIESIYVPKGWEVWVYSGSSYTGSTLKLTESWHGNGADDWQWRNSIRSARIVRSVWTSPYGPQFGKCLGVAVFTSTDLTGEHFFLTEDWDGSTNTRFRGQIESIYVPPGWQVWVFTNENFSGNARLLTASWNGKGNDDWKWRNAIRSIRVAADFPYDIDPQTGMHTQMCLDVSQPPDAQPCVTVYQHNMKGSSMCLTSDWTVGNLHGWHFNDEISSIVVPEGMRIVVYEHANFEGRSLTIGPGRWTPPSWTDFWNDRISSIRIMRDDGR